MLAYIIIFVCLSLIIIKYFCLSQTINLQFPGNFFRTATCYLNISFKYFCFVIWFNLDCQFLLAHEFLLKTFVNESFLDILLAASMRKNWQKELMKHNTRKTNYALHLIKLNNVFYTSLELQVSLTNLYATLVGVEFKK